VKIAHLADIHLGFRQFHRQTPAGINQREADVANAFRAAVDGVILAAPDAVIIAGDLFHSVRPTNAAIVFAFHQLQRLREALPLAPVIVVAGNHDTPRSAETGSILELYTQLGVDVAAHEARRFHYPTLDLSVLAVPYEALIGSERPELRPDGSATHQVLAFHREVEGVLPLHRSTIQYEAGPVVRQEDIAVKEWDYVALGHYHVQHRVSSNEWYSGALEYVTTNPWGELLDEAERGGEGKGWLLVELGPGKATVTRQPVPRARRLLDLDSLDAAGRTSDELSADIDARVHAVPGGIEGNIVRLVVRNVPRHVARELDHAAIRAYKAEALHFHLDLRRPESGRRVGVGAPGRRQTLPEVVEAYLSGRPLPAEVDRDVFVRTGVTLIEAIDREPAE
jgi:hypothetical protein